MQPDGSSVSISESVGSDLSWSLVRRTASGAADSSFGVGGTVTTTFTNLTGHASPTALALQADGKLVLVGYDQSTAGDSRDWMITRLNTDGSLDTSFNGGGLARVDFAGNGDYANDVVIQADGRKESSGRPSTTRSAASRARDVSLSL